MNRTNSACALPSKAAEGRRTPRRCRVGHSHAHFRKNLVNHNALSKGCRSSVMSFSLRPGCQILNPTRFCKTAVDWWGTTIVPKRTESFSLVCRLWTGML